MASIWFRELLGGKASRPIATVLRIENYWGAIAPFPVLPFLHVTINAKKSNATQMEIPPGITGDCLVLDRTLTS